ncbi:MAG: hypothetical protein PHY42_00840 [Bacilli bacterium]|nr:hypothetical protein [Bacilli bacterium]
MKAYKIASILLGFSHPDNPLIDDRLVHYETQESPQYEMSVLYHPCITIQEEVTMTHEQVCTYEDSDKTITYTYNKSHQLLSKVTIAKDMKRIVIELSEVLGSKLPMMEYVTTGLYFFEIALHAGYLPLHASAIIHESKAVLFSAPSGVGKSTQANLWKTMNPKIEILNDDKPLILCKDEIRVFGTPWCGKTFQNKNTSVPLKAITFIEQGLENVITPLSNEEKMIHLFKNTHRSQISTNLETTITSMQTLIEKGNLFFFTCTKTQEAYDTLYQYLYGEVYD